MIAGLYEAGAEQRTISGTYVGCQDSVLYGD